MASQQEGAQRPARKSPLDRLPILLWTGNLCDVTIAVGGGDSKRKFRAHRAILSAASGVFGTMFHGSVSPGETPIEIPDLHPDGFDAMLRYVYGDTVQFSSVRNAVRTLAVASKYLMDGLKQACYDYLVHNVTPGVACYVYELACLYYVDCLKQLALYNFIINTEAVINDDSFLSAQQSTVQTILRQDTLSVPSERQLFDAVLRWGKANTIKKRDGVKTIGNIRAVVVPLLPYIRFLSMSAVEFGKGPSKSGLLTDEEVLALVMNINSPGSRPLPPWVSSKFPRKSPKDTISVCTLCSLEHHDFDLSSLDVQMSVQRKVCVAGKTVVFWGVTLFVFDVTEHLNANSGAASVVSSSFRPNSHCVTAGFVFSIKSREYSVREQGTYKIEANGECSFVLKHPQVIHDGETCEIDIQFETSVHIVPCGGTQTVGAIGEVSFRPEGLSIHSVLHTVLEHEPV